MSETRSAAETIYPNQSPAPAKAGGGAAAPTETAPAPAETAVEQTPAPETAAPETAPTLLTEKPAEEATAKEAAEPPPPPFEADKITFPEGVTPDPEIFGEFSKIAESEKLSLNAAQQLIDLHHKIAGGLEQKNQDAWKTVREGWVAAVKADPEIGGDKLPGVVRKIAKILDNPALAHPGLRRDMEVTGMGDNHPLIWTLNRLADAITEGTFVSGDAPSRQAPRSLAQNIYPHLSPER
jgi:hypothetical protein